LSNFGTTSEKVALPFVFGTSWVPMIFTSLPKASVSLIPLAGSTSFRTPRRV
jgi:hypothetical protein